MTPPGAWEMLRVAPESELYPMFRGAPESVTEWDREILPSLVLERQFFV